MQRTLIGSNTVKFSMLVAILSLVGCNSSSEDTTSTDTSSSDITGTMLTNTSGDCEEYLGSFTASANDVQRDLLFTGQLTVTSSGFKCVIESNAIPNHDFNDNSASFATNVTEQTTYYEFDATPSQAASNTELSLSVSEVILLNGVKIDLLAAACYGVGSEPLGQEKIGCGEDQINNPWRYDPMSSLNTFGTDQHNAHVQPTGEYHYHGNPMALFIQNCAGNEASPVIGFAADGFPVYGSCYLDPADGVVKEATSSYQLKTGARQSVTGYTTPVSGVGTVASTNYDGQFRGDWEYTVALGTLDECNGMTVSGQYGYYVTNQFPWVVNCFKGEVDTSFSALSATRSHSH
ncbi:YHYH protein [Vibrio sp. T187]|uniref:YHYH protein n=1 Tax=Vibrio TaxID=662 RepID=UPI0010C952AA|nr:MULTISPECIES: YHYH protein [Vibrio]MBW3694558.1 YHYH protein [Vibrio sp. T187]